MPASQVRMSPILVTGGCGFIGHHIVQYLLKAESDPQIHVLDIDTSHNRFPMVTYHTCDIASAVDVDKALQTAKPRTIFHVASPKSLVILPDLYEKVNVGGTRNLLQSAAKLGTVQALVLTSTSSVIHDNVSDLIDAHESLPILRPPIQRRVYTLTKATAEEDVIAANRQNGDSSMLTVSMRPGTAIGENDPICLGKMITRAREGKMRYQIGDGKNIYDFTYISNLVDAHVLAAQALLRAYGKPPPPPNVRVDGESINVTNDENVLFWEFSRRVSELAGYPITQSEIVVIPTWVALAMAWCSEWIAWLRGSQQPIMTWEVVKLSVIHRTLNIDKAKRLLGYRPSVTLDEGLQRGVKWYVDQQKPEGKGAKET